MRVAVVGHLEWVQFARVERVPRPGEILHPTEAWEEPAGGGAVAAVQLARLAGESTFFTAIGDDELGRRSREGLERLGVRVLAATRPGPTRRGFTFIDAHGERTITTIGDRLAPALEDPVPWDDLANTDAVYVTAGDAGALNAARRARVVVATARILEDLAAAHVQLDALVGSARDPSERYEEGALEPPPHLVVLTEGRDGGTYRTADCGGGRFPPALPSGPLEDTYGAGDSFAAGLAYGLAAEPDDVRAALEVASRAGADAISRRGAHGEATPHGR